MTIKPVVKMGNAQLATPSLPVTEFATAGLYALLEDMKDTMREKGGVGIAAPQIGVNLRVVLFGFEKSERYPDAEPIAFTVLINPAIELLSDEKEEDWEGCLSVPGLRGLVPRHTKIRYAGFDEKGAPVDVMAEGFHARVVQHECDHLDGILYPQRIKDMRNFGFEDELGERAQASVPE
jgi:peptide deformylase